MFDKEKFFFAKLMKPVKSNNKQGMKFSVLKTYRRAENFISSAVFKFTSLVKKLCQPLFNLTKVVLCVS